MDYKKEYENWINGDFTDEATKDELRAIKAVSYTHLTLPTTPYV